MSVAELTDDPTPEPRSSAADPEIPQAAYESIVGLALGAAGANVIMQLSRLPIGHGVAKSTVDSGRVDKHPIKRLRTTVAYLVIALFGTETERDAMRRAVNRSHATVHAAPDDEVQYNAFDPELQLWVAACIAWGLRDMHERFYGPMDTETAEALHRHCAHLATTLQVSEAAWPADTAAFEAYWQAGLEQLEMDDLTRAYLLDLAELGFMPAPVRWTLGPFNRFVTYGFLPQEFRQELGVRWRPSDQRAFDTLMGGLAQVNRLLPGPVRRFPWNLYLWDARRRIRTGKALV